MKFGAVAVQDQVRHVVTTVCTQQAAQAETMLLNQLVRARDANIVCVPAEHGRVQRYIHVVQVWVVRVILMDIT